MSRTYGNFTDFIDFSRSSGGTALRRVSYGPELVTNGTFDSDTTGWTTQSGASVFTVSSGQLTISRSAVDPGYVYQIISTTAGNVYSVSFDVVDDGPIDLRIGTSPGGLQIAASGIKSSAGTYTLSFVATGSTAHISAVNTSYSVDATIDNVSVKVVTFDQSSGDLVLFNHPDDIPRVEYDANGVLKGLLIEEARTNLFTYSNDFSGNWGKNASPTVSSGASAGPDGTLSMSRLTCSGITNSGLYEFVSNPTGVATYTYSVFMRAVSNAGNIKFRLEGTSLSTSIGIIYDAHNASFVANSNVAPDTYSIVDFGNDIYRVSVTATTIGAGTLGGVIYDNSTDGAVVDIYGAQLEQGSFPTSYIPTSGATATRSSDLASIATSNFGYNKKNYTLVFEMSLLGRDTSTYPRVLQMGASTGNLSFYCTSTNIYYDKSGTGALATRGITLNTLEKFAASVGEGGGEFHEQTPAGYASTTTEVDRDISTVHIGSNGVNNQLNGYIRSIKYLPRKLTSTQLQEFTS